LTGYKLSTASQQPDKAVLRPSIVFRPRRAMDLSIGDNMGTKVTMTQEMRRSWHSGPQLNIINTLDWIMYYER
jgi:hypothetical protein